MAHAEYMSNLEPSPWRMAGVGTRILVHDIAHVEMLVVDAHYQKETRDALPARCHVIALMTE